MTDLPDEIFQKPEQHLTLNELHAVVLQEPPNPPQVLLMQRVTHDETGHTWTQQVHVTRLQTEMFTRLLIHLCQQHGLDIT